MYDDVCAYFQHVVFLKQLQSGLLLVTGKRAVACKLAVKFLHCTFFFTDLLSNPYCVMGWLLMQWYAISDCRVMCPNDYKCDTSLNLDAHNHSRYRIMLNPKGEETCCMSMYTCSYALIF